MGNLAPPQHNRDFRANRLSEDTVARNAALRDRIRAAHRVMSAAMAEILDAAAEADETESYWADGAQTTDEWLVGNLGVRSFTARRWAKLARSLRDFPHLRMSMRDGELSIDQAYELVKFLEPDQGPEFMAELRHDSADALAAHARSQRTVSPEKVKENRSERWVESFFDHDDLKLHLKAEIPGQDGLLIDKALSLLAWNAPEEPGFEQPRYPEHRLADALVEMASNALANQSDTDIATVVVHADAEKLGSPDAVGHAEFATDIPMEAIRRMCCDGRVQLAARDERGVLGVGRVQRTIPHWLRRLLRDRDQGCRFPGCSRTYWTQIHHIVHWAHGGTTDLHNLITLCGHHHRMLHEDGWYITGDPQGRVRFRFPSGEPFEWRPAAREWQRTYEFEREGLLSWFDENDLARPGPG